MSKTVLIAEDETVLRESLAELLTEEGYEVLQACNGKGSAMPDGPRLPAGRTGSWRPFSILRADGPVHGCHAGR